jgi:hypothetical protein
LGLLPRSRGLLMPQTQRASVLPWTSHKTPWSCLSLESECLDLGLEGLAHIPGLKAVVFVG